MTQIKNNTIKNQKTVSYGRNRRMPTPKPSPTKAELYAQIDVLKQAIKSIQKPN